jgi:hypothetical protein
VVKYHGLGLLHRVPHGFLTRPLLNGGTLGERIMARDSYATANSILGASRELGLWDVDFQQLPGWRAAELLDRVLDVFTNRGRGDRLKRWIWNDLREPSAFLQTDLNLLGRFGSPDDRVWLITEDFGSTKQGPPFWSFEGTLGAVSATLDNHHLLEFVVVSQPLTWLVGQNHHDVWFASGTPAVAVLQGLSAKSATNGAE